VDNFLGFLGTLGRPLPGSPEDAILLDIMTIRMMSMTGVIRMMRPVKKRVTKMMQMKMRMRINLRMIRMIKDEDGKGRG